MPGIDRRAEQGTGIPDDGRHTSHKEVPEDFGHAVQAEDVQALRDAPMGVTAKVRAVAREMAGLSRLLPVLKAMGTTIAGTVKAHA